MTYVCNRAKEMTIPEKFLDTQAYELFLQGFFLYIFCRGSDSWFKGLVWLGTDVQYNTLLGIMSCCVVNAKQLLRHIWSSGFANQGQHVLVK